MARIARAAARGYPHPIPERGKHRRGTFFGAAGCRAPCARLVKVQRGNRAAERPYDGRNRRITKTVGETATHFFFNESWQVLETRVGSAPNPLDQYLWDIRYIDAAVVRFHDAGTNGSYEDAGDNILYYTQDANFNTTALVDEATGDVAERNIYTSYGEATFLDGSWSLTVVSGVTENGTASAYGNETLYGGYGLDAESGLYHAQRREYHCSLGRWIEDDPGGYLDGQNLYQYCLSNPAGATDPSGLWTKVQRQGEERASVCAEVGDSWSDLAKEIRLDADEYMLWAKPKDGQDMTDPPQPGTYSVPNKIILDFGGWGPLESVLGNNALTRIQEVLRVVGSAYRLTGCMVKTYNWNMLDDPNNGTPDMLARHMADQDLWAYGYAGHGADGKLAYGRGLSKVALARGKYVHHRIAFMMLLACESLAPSSAGIGYWNPDTIGQRSDGFSEWETNVSNNGELFGYTIEFRGSEADSAKQIRPGGLRSIGDARSAIPRVQH